MNTEEALQNIRDASYSIVGSRTTPSKVDGYSVVPTSPMWLAASAGVDESVYSLARMVSSEAGSANAETLLALAETARNKAIQRGVSVTSLLTQAKVASSNGLYGEQAAGRWASTRLDPNGRHLAAADAALNGGTTFAQGATDFFDPATQDTGVQNGHALKQSSSTYIANRDKEGLHWVGPLPGIDPRKAMFFARGTGYSLDDALAAASGIYQGDYQEGGVESIASVLDDVDLGFDTGDGDGGGGSTLLVLAILALAIGALA